ncbi:hypothetical protein B0T14DRAFT_335580 [Immersiella caudata]|uniref:Chitin-binding type-1 domain-containing protein n=1 Tax=Immersiella caudata TaxID=314043 RepID=A0AA39TLK7_9PEZI|nr:hypothetical protein B0T14DRAFT_335580 [Immersiella caudata]
MAFRFLRGAALAAILWKPDHALGQAACSTFVAAQTGDTCLSLASLAGISVTQFLRNNPQVTSCDKLNVGDNYCVEVPKSTSTPKQASPATTSGSPGNGGVRITTDGHCGDGWTCVGSAFGQCCSEHGWCGDSEEHCGPKCQRPFGNCAGSGSSSSVAPPSPTNGTVSRTTVTVTTTVLQTSVVSQPGSAVVSTVSTVRTVSATVTLPAATVTTTAPGISITRTVSATVTVPTTVAGVGATRTVSVSSVLTLPPATITVISVVRTTLTVETTSVSTSVREVTQTETETEIATVTHNLFRTITIISTEYSTTTARFTEIEAVPTTVYRTQTVYSTTTAQLPARTFTITDWATITKLETTTAWSTRISTQYLERTVTSTNTVNVAVPYPTTVVSRIAGGTATVTLLRTVTLLNGNVGTTTVTALKTVTLNNGGGGGGYTVTVRQIETMTVFKTITAPGGFQPGQTVTRTVTVCEDIWRIGGKK